MLNQNAQLSTQATNLEVVEAKIWQGIKLEQENKLDEAIEHYRQAIESNSQSAVAHNILAIALKKQGNLIEAERYHQLALSLSQDNDVKQMNEIGAQSGNYLEANSSIELIKSNSSVVLPKVTAVSPGTYVEHNKLEVTKIYLQQAKLYYNDRKWQESINACQEALKICPDLPETYKIYGNCLQQLGREAEAMGYYAKAVAKDPYFAEVYANIGSLYAKQNNWQEAINYYQKALEIEPKFAKVCLHLSRAWERMGEYDRALNCLLHGLKLQPDILNVVQLVELGEELLAEGKLELAITCYEYAIKIEPETKKLYLKLIKILEEDGQWQKVAGYYQQIVKLQENDASDNPKKLRINNLLTQSNNRSQTKLLPPSKSNNEKLVSSNGAIVKRQDSLESDDLVERYLEELKKQPNSPEIRLNLGNLFARKQQWQQSIANYQQAIKLKPDLVMAHLRLGKVYGIVGKTIEGAESIFRAYSLQPEIATPEQHYKLGEFWLKQEQSKVAMTCYRRAIQLKPDFKAAYNKLKGLIESEKQHQKTTFNSPSKQSHNIITPQEKIKSDDSTTSLVKHSQVDEKSQKYQIYFDMALAAEKEAKLELALQCYRQAIIYSPHNKETYYGIGKLLARQQKWQEVVDLYQKAIQYNSQEFSYHHNLGNAYYELEKWQEAISSFQSSIAINNKFSWSHFKLGEALMELKQWKLAADAFNNSIELKSDFDWAHHKLGDVAYELKDWDTAVRAYQNTLKITPDLPKTQEKLTDALRQRSQADKVLAENFYNKAIKVNPDDESLYFKALEVKPDNPDHYLKLAQIYESKGKINVALSFYKIALQVNPNNAEAKAKLNTLQL